MDQKAELTKLLPPEIPPEVAADLEDTNNSNVLAENIIGPNDIKVFPGKEMVFVDKMLNNFEAVSTYAQNQRKATEEFIFVIKERSSRELLYARELQKLCSRDFSGFSGTLGNAMSGLKQDFSNRIQQC